MSNTVIGIYTAERAGAPMCSRTAVDLVAGVGIAGDRYATGLGHWSDPRWPDQELTLFESEVAEALGVPAESIRRNLVTRGVRLDDLIGREFRIGSAVLLGVRHCDPCRYIETLTRQGMTKDLSRRGGLRAAVRIGGRIAVGDAIAVA